MKNEPVESPRCLVCGEEEHWGREHSFRPDKTYDRSVEPVESRSGKSAPCPHERLDEDGYCRKCGVDMRSGKDLTKLAGESAQTDLISHDQAAESALRFINAFFNNPGRTKPQIRIPRDPTDDDAILMAYIRQQRAREAAQHAPRQPECPDCDEAAKHAYSDATTPGFFSPKCKKHRADPPSASEGEK